VTERTILVQIKNAVSLIALLMVALPTDAADCPVADELSVMMGHNQNHCSGCATIRRFWPGDSEELKVP